MRILCPKAFASTLPCLGGCGFLDALSTFSYISFSWIFGGDCCALKGSRVGRILGRWRDGDTWSPCSNELWNVTEACFDMQQYHANQGYVASHLHFARLWLFLFLPQWLAWLLDWGGKNVSNGDALCGYVGCNTYGYFHQFLGRLSVVPGADQTRWRQQRLRSDPRIARISLKMVGFRLLVDPKNFCGFSGKQHPHYPHSLLHSDRDPERWNPVPIQKNKLPVRFSYNPGVLYDMDCVSSWIVSLIWTTSTWSPPLLLLVVVIVTVVVVVVVVVVG